MGAKRSQRRSVRYEKDQSGCMWGLISMFDFRQARSTRKLIADKKHGSKHISGTGISKNKFEVLRNLEENCQGIIDGEESVIVTVTNAGSNKPSVKKLIEEEMVNEQCPKREARDMLESKQPEPSEEDRITAGHKKSKRTRKKSRDMDNLNPGVAENVKLEFSHRQNDTDQPSAKDLGFDEIMEEFSRRIHRESVNCPKDSDFEEKLKAAIKEFVVHKLSNGKHRKGDHKIRSSKELMSELELMSSDEELFRKLVQDPESLLVKYAQNWEESALIGLVDASKSEDLINHKHRSFFRRRAKSQERNPANEDENPETLNRIVILKPGPSVISSEPEREPRISGGGSHFSISEIKRRLKHAMGKQHHETPPMPRIEASDKPFDKRRIQGNIGRNSPTKEHFYIERMTKPSNGGSKRSDKKSTAKDSETSKPGNDERISNIYVEAKKHLSEMLSTGDDADLLSSRQNPKTLGRILSLPEYSNSPAGSPGRDWEKSFVTARTRFASKDKFGTFDESLVMESQNLESPKVQACDSNHSVSDDIVCEIEVEETVKDETSREDDSTHVKEENTCSSSPRDNQNDDVPDGSDDNSHFTTLEKDSNEENLLHSSPPGSPSSSLITDKVSDLEIATELPEKPSPVSVLDPIFAEDDISPANTTSQPIKLTIEPLRIRFEEPDSTPTTEEFPSGKGFVDEKDAIFSYTMAVIQASGFNWDEICVKLLSSDQLLDPVSLNKVELFSNRLCRDETLLFDCTNEVLVELCRYYFGSSPWVSFTKPGVRPIPDAKSAALEAFKGVYWHLLQPPLPRTLEQIVGKDMERTRTWSDARFEAETIGFEIGEAILQDIVEDTILSYADENTLECVES